MEKKLEISGALGLPFMAHLKTTYTQTWKERSEAVIDGAARHAELTDLELEAQLLDNGPLRDVLWLALERASVVAEAEYADVLARLVAAACDPARVDEASYLVAQISKLEPVELRALLAAGTFTESDFTAEDIAAKLVITPMLAQAVVQVLSTFRLVYNFETGTGESEGLINPETWIVTDWAREVLDFLGLTVEPPGS